MNQMYQNTEKTTESDDNYSAKVSSKVDDKKTEEMARELRQLQDRFAILNEEVNKLKRTVRNTNNTVDRVVSSLNSKNR